MKIAPSWYQHWSFFHCFIRSLMEDFLPMPHISSSQAGVSNTDISSLGVSHVENKCLCVDWNSFDSTTNKYFAPSFAQAWSYSRCICPIIGEIIFPSWGPNYVDFLLAFSEYWFKRSANYISEVIISCETVKWVENSARSSKHIKKCSTIWVATGQNIERWAFHFKTIIHISTYQSNNCRD